MFVQCAHVKKYERKCNKITDRPAPILRKSCQIFYTMLLLINVPHGPWSTFKSLSFINLRYDVIFLLLSEICIGFLVGKIPHHQRRNGENSFYFFSFFGTHDITQSHRFLRRRFPFCLLVLLLPRVQQSLGTLTQKVCAAPVIECDVSKSLATPVNCGRRTISPTFP